MNTIQQNEQISRRYFLIGFAGLPLLWIINAVWFGAYLLSDEPLEELQNETTIIESMNVEKRNEMLGHEICVAKRTRNHTLLQNIYWYVVGSLIGFVVWIILALCWINVYQSNRLLWSESVDWLTFSIPRGV